MASDAPRPRMSDVPSESQVCDWLRRLDSIHKSRRRLLLDPTWLSDAESFERVKALDVEARSIEHHLLAMRDHLEQVAGDGTPHARLTALLGELEKLFPGLVNPLSSRAPEPKYLAAILAMRERLDRAESALDRIAPLTCAECGPHVAIDEDGCCTTCGADLTPDEDYRDDAPGDPIAAAAARARGWYYDSEGVKRCSECNEEGHRGEDCPSVPDELRDAPGEPEAQEPTRRKRHCPRCELR